MEPRAVDSACLYPRRGAESLLGWEVCSRRHGGVWSNFRRAVCLPTAGVICHRQSNSVLVCSFVNVGAGDSPPWPASERLLGVFWWRWRMSAAAPDSPRYPLLRRASGVTVLPLSTRASISCRNPSCLDTAPVHQRVYNRVHDGSCNAMLKH